MFRISQIHRQQSTGKQTGLTIVEMVITIVILGISLSILTAIIKGGLNESADTMIQVRTVALGSSYLDEILGKKYDENVKASGVPPCYSEAGPDACTAEVSFGPEGAEVGNRDQFDDVDDYHGLSEGAGEVDPLQDSEGNTRSGYENYHIDITVRYLDVGAGEFEQALSGTFPSMDTLTDGKVITIAVSYLGLDQPYYFTAYRANY